MKSESGRAKYDYCIGLDGASVITLAPVTNRKRILIVDDDPDIRDLLADFLDDEGYSTGCAANGAEALEALASVPTDTILLDLNMSVMNGYQFLARRAEDPRLSKIDVIVMSASAPRLEATVETSLISKPLDLDALVTMLRRCPDPVTQVTGQ